MGASFGGQCSTRENNLVSDTIHYDSSKIVASVQADTPQTVCPHVRRNSGNPQKSSIAGIVADNIWEKAEVPVG